MINSFEIATEGLLQDGDGQCLKTVVRTETVVQATQSTQNVTVARENGGVLVAAGVTAPVTVTPAPTETVSADRVDTQIIVAPGCASAPGGVSSYNDLTDVPTEFPPEAHDHVIGDVTGLEDRLFTDETTFIFDIDAENADDGTTDPYKFVTANAAYAAVWELIPRLTIGADNFITLLFGDGTYSLLDFHTQFVGLGANSGTSMDGCPIMLAQARIFIKAKNYPDVIPDNAWSAIASTATYTAQSPAADAVNKALITSAFNVVFYASDAEIAAAPWTDCCLGIPANFILDGVAFMFEECWRASYNSPYFEHWGAYGLGGYAVVNAYGWWADDTYSAINDIPSTYAADAMLYDPTFTDPYRRPMYFVNASCRLPIKYSQTFLSSVNAMKIVDVNPVSQLVFVESHDYYHNFGMQIICIGALGFTSAPAGSGWLHIITSQPVDLFFRPGSVCPSGQTLITFRTPKGSPGESHIMYLPASSAQFPGVKLENTGYFPQKMQHSYAVVTGRFTGGMTGRFSYSHGISLPAKPGTYSGTGSPNGTVYGYTGDMYINTSGGANNTLWIKESGANTNTGWVAK